MTEIVGVREGEEPPHIPATAQVCGNCCWARSKNKEQEHPRQRQCRRHPPQLMWLPISGPPLIKGGPPEFHWVNNCAYPPVDVETAACGEFEPKAELVN